MPARIKLLIADLGLRYRPTAATDLEAHGTAIGLLTLDLADIPPDRLDRAISEWVRSERWMPKASELIAICQRHQREEISGRQGNPAFSANDAAFAFCESRNADLWSGNHPRKDAGDLEWFVDRAGSPQLRYRRTATPEIEPIHPKLVAARNESMVKLNAVFRYDDAGRSRALTATEEARRIERGGSRFD